MCRKQHYKDMVQWQSTDWKDRLQSVTRKLVHNWGTRP